MGFLLGLLPSGWLAWIKIIAVLAIAGFALYIWNSREALIAENAVLSRELDLAEEINKRNQDFIERQEQTRIRITAELEKKAQIERSLNAEVSNLLRRIDNEEDGPVAPALRSAVDGMPVSR